MDAVIFPLLANYDFFLHIAGVFFLYELHIGWVSPTAWMIFFCLQSMNDGRVSKFTALVSLERDKSFFFLFFFNDCD